MRLQRYELTGHLIISREPLHHGRSNDLTNIYQGWEKENMCTHFFRKKKNLLEDAVRKIKKESKYLTGKEILNAN
jgi:hypothetical protein